MIQFTVGLESKTRDSHYFCKNAISDMIFSFLLLTLSAPPETGRAGAIKKSAGRPRLDMYST